MNVDFSAVLLSLVAFCGLLWLLDSLLAKKSRVQAVEDFKAGNSKSFNFLVGKIMATTKGKASPAEVSKIIKELIDKN